MNDEQDSADTIQFPASKSTLPKRQIRRSISRHYFVLDSGTIRSVDQKQMERAWRGEEPWLNDGEVRILTVLHVKPENIVGCFVLLVSVVNGKFDRESIEEAYQANFEQGKLPNGRKDGLLPGYARQTAGWPAGWQQQVATALGIDVKIVRDLGAGGPLMSAVTQQTSITESARNYAQSLRFLYGTTPQKELRGSVDFSLTTTLQPWDGDVSLYLLEVAGQVQAILPGADDYKPETVGELKLLIIKMAEAVKAGVPICGICDCHSGELEEVWSTLFDGNEFLEEFNLSSPSGDLLYLDEISLQPEYESSPLYYQAIETAIATFASCGLVVAYKAVFSDDAKRWRKLGFKEIPRSELLVRRVKRIRA